MAAKADSGIYEIVNLVNGKRYVGSAVNLKYRWIYHRRDLRGRRHHSKYLQASWSKHGESAFLFRVMELVSDKSQLIAREQCYIDALRPEYNSRPNAASNLGHRWTEERKAKLSLERKGRRVLPIGYKHSAETIRKLTERMRANPTFLGKLHKAETKKKISEARKALFESDPTAIDVMKRALARPEVRAKKAARMAGNTFWLGKKHSQETKDKLRDMFIGKIVSAESRKRMSEAQRRKAPPSAETRAKMGVSRSGLRNGSAIRVTSTIQHNDGRRLTDIPMNLRRESGLSPAALCQLMSGYQKCAKGWRLVTEV